MTKQRFTAWLSTLVVPLGLLSLWHYWPEAPRSPSIGGGGYDLADLVFTVLALGFSGIWALLALMIACFQDNKARRRDGLALAGFGGVLFCGTLLLYGHKLS